MHIEKLKVRPRQGVFLFLSLPYPIHGRLCAVTAVRPCTTQFASMLACWSATGDVMSTSACADSAKQLLTCMRTAVSTTYPPPPGCDKMC